MQRNPHKPTQAGGMGEFVISQAILEEIKDLREEHRRCKELTREVVELLKEGAEIESGALTARVVQQSQRRLTPGKLAALLGEEGVENLRCEVEPTVCEILKIADSQD